MLLLRVADFLVTTGAIKATVNNTYLIKGQVAFDVTYTVFSSSNWLSVETSSLRASKQLEMSSVGEEGSPGEDTDIVKLCTLSLALNFRASPCPKSATPWRHYYVM